jgi:hypothetical protein
LISPAIFFVKGGFVIAKEGQTLIPSLLAQRWRT